jgi:two-component system CheB/CheR fusion protein
VCLWLFAFKTFELKAVWKRCTTRTGTRRASGKAREETFLAVLAHEIRQPIHVIDTCLSILDSTREAAAVDRVVENTRRSIEQVIRLVDDLLVAARGVGAPLSIVRSPVDLEHLLRESVTEIADAAARNGVFLNLAVSGRPTLDADPVRLRQVLHNLLSNALKFTPPGGYITVQAEDIGDRVCVTVADTGEGIPAERIGTLFRRFSQNEQRRDHHGFRGLGLGLWLVQEIVHAHGGKVEAASDGPGGGSWFIVTLPGHPRPPRAEPLS